MLSDEVEAWPRMALRTLRSTPAARRQDAQAWRATCRRIGVRPASDHTLSQRVYRASTERSPRLPPGRYGWQTTPAVGWPWRMDSSRSSALSGGTMDTTRLEAVDFS